MATTRKFAGKIVQGETDLFKSGSIRTVPVEELSLNPENGRTLVWDEDFARSIEENGILNPLQIYEDGLVEGGNRRLWHILGLKEQGRHFPAEVPCIVVQRPATEREAILRKLNVNAAEQFPPLDQAAEFAKLRAEGMNNTEIAKLTPFTAMHVGNMLTLWDASDEVKQLVRDGKLSATLAVETLRREDGGEEVLLAAWEKAEADGKKKTTQRYVDAVIEANRPEPEPAPEVEEVQVDGDDATGEEGEDGGDAGQTDEPGEDGDDVPFDVDGDEGDDQPVDQGDEEIVGMVEVTGDDAAPEGSDEPVTDVEVTADDDAAGERPAAAANNAGSASDGLTFNAKVAREMMAQFLPSAKALIEAARNGTDAELVEEIRDNFLQALEGLVIECDTYGIKPADAA